MEISKELFEAVMNIKLGTYYSDNIETERRLWIDKDLICWDAVPFVDEISINDFFFECKNWAFKGGYELSSGYHIYGLQYKGHKDANKIYCDCRYYNNEEIQVRRFFANTEQQCIFDACQWILENKRN